MPVRCYRMQKCGGGTMGWRAEYQGNEPREIRDEDGKEGLGTGNWGVGTGRH